MLRSVVAGFSGRLPAKIEGNLELYRGFSAPFFQGNGGFIFSGCWQAQGFVLEIQAWAFTICVLANFRGLWEWIPATG